MEATCWMLLAVACAEGTGPCCPGFWLGFAPGSFPSGRETFGATTCCWEPAVTTDVCGWPVQQQNIHQNVLTSNKIVCYYFKSSNRILNPSDVTLWRYLNGFITEFWRNPPYSCYSKTSMWRKGWRLSCDVGEVTERLENELCYAYNYQLCSFSNLSVTSSTSQLILQSFHCFT